MVFDCELFGDYPRGSGFEWPIVNSPINCQLEWGLYEATMQL